MRKYFKDKICAITLQKLKRGKNKLGQSRTIFLPCKHPFSRTGLLDFVISNKDNIYPCCPLCRKIFDPVLAFV